jgi:hypothetical protein
MELVNLFCRGTTKMPFLTGLGAGIGYGQGVANGSVVSTVATRRVAFLSRNPWNKFHGYPPASLRDGSGADFQALPRSIGHSQVEPMPLRTELVNLFCRGATKMPSLSRRQIFTGARRGNRVERKKSFDRRSRITRMKRTGKFCHECAILRDSNAGVVSVVSTVATRRVAFLERNPWNEFHGYHRASLRWGNGAEF